MHNQYQLYSCAWNVQGWSLQLFMFLSMQCCVLDNFLTTATQHLWKVLVPQPINKLFDLCAGHHL